MKKIAIVAMLLLSIGTAAFAVCPGTLEILNETLGMGFVGIAYSNQMDAWGGTPGYTWALYSGSFPPGISMNSSGAITGTPTTAGNWTPCIRLTDSAGCTRHQCFEFYVE